MNKLTKIQLHRKTKNTATNLEILAPNRWQQSQGANNNILALLLPTM